MTHDEAQKLIRARFMEYPDFGAVANATTLKAKLTEILAFGEVGDEFLPIIENELNVVLALYAPISELGANIAESTNISIEKANKISSLIKALILEPVESELLAYDLLWQQEEALPDANIESKERLELRPNGQPSIGSSAGGSSQPLTRDALMNAVSGKRTMAQDIEALRMRREAEKGSSSTPQKPTI